MVDWESEHFTFRADAETKKLIRRNKDYLDDNFNSTTELAKKALRIIDEENSSIDEKIKRLKTEEQELRKKETEKRQRRKELEEQRRRKKIENQISHVESEVQKLSDLEGLTRDEIEEKVVEQIMENRNLSTREEVMDSCSDEVIDRVEDKLRKLEKLNKKKKQLKKLREKSDYHRES